jgi:hypothetical protein
MAKGSVRAIHVAHGSGSDPKKSGYARSFSNVPNSKKSSLGFYKVSETYNGKHGRSAKMDGLSSTNSNVRRRAIVLHGSDYVKENGSKPGRSQGCFAIAKALKDGVIDQLMGGAIIYAGLSSSDHAADPIDQLDPDDDNGEYEDGDDGSGDDGGGDNGGSDGGNWDSQCVNGWDPQWNMPC